MLKGIDVSHYQTVGEYGTAIKDGYYNFMMIKATEGTTYIDPSISRHLSWAVGQAMCIGFYHYARPENNPAKDEAKHFVEVVKKQGYLGEAILALDYEGNALQYGSEWALEFLDTVYELCGVKPILYLQASAVKDYRAVAEKNYGLWVAKWSNTKPAITPWNVTCMWQCSGSPIDLDIFYGTRETWYAYAKIIEKEKDTTSNTDNTLKELLSQLSDLLNKITPLL